MAGAKNHDYHILPPSITPILGSFSALTMFFGLVMWMHPEQFSFGSLVFGIGLIGVLYTFYAWWADVVTEAHAGDHTPVVQLHLRYGMIMFIASEVMFFVGWFWAWFDFSLFPVPLEIVKDAETHAFTVSNLIGQEGAAALMQWPPKGLEVLDSMKLPLLNTLILLCSGTTVTWAHHALIHGDRDDVVPFQEMQVAGNALVAAGFPTFGHVMQGAGHGIAPDGLGVAMQFLKERLPR